MSSRVATVIPPDGLNLRTGPSTETTVLGVLAAGQKVTITARTDVWRQIDSPLGPGFAHGDFLTVDGTLSVNEEPPGLDTEIPPADLGEGDDRTGAPAPVAFYTVEFGDVLSSIGEKLGLDWREIAAANGIPAPFVVHPNQVLRLPGAPLQVAHIIVRNPLPSSTLVTSSSAQFHHRPYGGTHSCDLDVIGVLSSGTAVRFNVDPEGVEARGVVRLIGPACRSGLISDGGQKVQINLQHRPIGGGDWRDSGAWLLYAHLDPVDVSVDDVIAPGQRVGELGPPGGGEYNSSCAQGSHVHVEATRGTFVIDVDEQGVDRAIIAIAI